MFLSLKLSLNGERISSVTPPPPEFFYFRPDLGRPSDRYLRPDSISFYLRP